MFVRFFFMFDSRTLVGCRFPKRKGEMAMTHRRGVAKQKLARLMDELMAQGAVSAERKFIPHLFCRHITVTSVCGPHSNFEFPFRS